MKIVEKFFGKYCPICFETKLLNKARPCKHSCCNNCWKSILQNTGSRCPFCRKRIYHLSGFTVNKYYNRSSDFDYYVFVEI